MKEDKALFAIRYSLFAERRCENGSIQSSMQFSAGLGRRIPIPQTNSEERITNSANHAPNPAWQSAPSTTAAH